jgi:hypothetical protein
VCSSDLSVDVRNSATIRFSCYVIGSGLQRVVPIGRTMIMVPAVAAR